MRTFSGFTPQPSTRVLMSTAVVTSFIRVTPVTGLSWWPVMPVVLLSRMKMLVFAPLYTALIRPVMPEWKKVESPIKENTFRRRWAKRSTRSKP